MGLRIYDAYDVSGVSGTSSAGTWIPLAVVNGSIGGMYTYTTNICEGFLQATQAWETTDWCQLSSNHTALNMVCNTSSNNTAVSGGNLLLSVSSSKTRLCFNTTTPYNNATYGTAPITLNAGNMYIKCTNDLNDGSAGYDTAMFLESSNASAPVGFAFQLSTGANTTSINAVYMGTTSNNDLRFMCNNSLRMTLTAAGRLGIGTSTPACPLHASGTNATYSIGAGGTATAYLYQVAGGTYSNLGLGPYSATVSALFTGSILVKTGVYAESDRRRKTDISPINISLDHYDKLNPVSYRYKEEQNFKLGLIAQEAMQVSQEVVSFFPNETWLLKTQKLIWKVFNIRSITGR
ncbi:unnamed protein product [Phytophthora lilii]|uniref:Unnamed protein product n=1 Tax=Phytophthora lilii TaxID=2077276 RepID=A0A9W6TDI2_9STRA|nr:unnamed protein product [Phytophthora lilii]